MTMDIKWFEKSGKEGDVVISSRIRLALKPAKNTVSYSHE